MTSPSTSKISKTLLGILFFSLAFTMSLAQAQENPEEESKAYEQIKATAAPAEKAELAIKFLQKYPKGTYRDQAIYEYQTGMVALHGAKNWNSIISAGDKFLDVVPGDKFTVEYLAAAYEATGNTKGFATFGEKIYAAKPSPALATALAYAYLKLGNDAKFLQWGEKTLAGDPDNVSIAAEMIGKYLRNQNYAQTTKYARMLLKALPTAKKPENVDAKDWKNSLDSYNFTAYYALGAIAFNNNSFVQAVSNLDNAVKYNKRSDMAYYYLGMCHWQTNKLQPAMLNFAKAVVLKGSTSNAAKQNLEKLWKNSHRGALTGIDTVYKRAQQDLK